MKVFESLVSPSYQEEIKRRLLSGQWNFLDDITYSSDGFIPGGSWGFVHKIVDGGRVVSGVYDFLLPLVYAACDQSGVKLTGILKARSFMQTPMKDSSPDPIHVDLTNTKHTVLLYYVKDSDGRTILSDKRHDLSLSDAQQDILIGSPYRVIEAIEPKQGKAVMFDGFVYHTAEKPTKDVRCILNFDLVVE